MRNRGYTNLYFSRQEVKHIIIFFSDIRMNCCPYCPHACSRKANLVSVPCTIYSKSSKLDQLVSCHLRKCNTSITIYLYKHLLQKKSKRELIRYACDMCVHVPKILKKHKQSKREGSIHPSYGMCQYAATTHLYTLYIYICMYIYHLDPAYHPETRRRSRGDKSPCLHIVR